jgi:hypothetical protein
LFQVTMRGLDFFNVTERCGKLTLVSIQTPHFF